MFHRTFARLPHLLRLVRVGEKGRCQFLISYSKRHVCSLLNAAAQAPIPTAAVRFQTSLPDWIGRCRPGKCNDRQTENRKTFHAVTLYLVPLAAWFLHALSIGTLTYSRTACDCFLRCQNKSGYVDRTRRTAIVRLKTVRRRRFVRMRFSCCPKIVQLLTAGKLMAPNTAATASIATAPVPGA